MTRVCGNCGKLSGLTHIQDILLSGNLTSSLIWIQKAYFKHLNLLNATDCEKRKGTTVSCEEWYNKSEFTEQCSNGFVFFTDTIFYDLLWIMTSCREFIVGLTTKVRIQIAFRPGFSTRFFYKATMITTKALCLTRQFKYMSFIAVDCVLDVSPRKYNLPSKQKSKNNLTIRHVTRKQVSIPI